MNIRTRISATDVRPGDVLLTHVGSPKVARVTTSKKGKTLVWVGQGEPVALAADAQVWVGRAPISQAPTA